jgi:transcriptional regulator with XRE-family HTH domain
MTDSFLKIFGKHIRQLRKSKGYSQESFATKLKLHRTYIGAIERGEKNITIKNLEKLANCLELKISDIFIGIDA